MPDASRLSRLQEFLASLPLAESIDCGYYPDQKSDVRMFAYGGAFEPIVFDYLLNQGFRRSGDIYYRNQCRHCQRCLGYRVDLKNWEPTRSQRKILNRNRDVQLRVMQPKLTEQRAELYLRYQYQQHYLKPLAGSQPLDFEPEAALQTMQQQMYANTSQTIEMEFLLDSQLLAFAVFDLGQTAISAVYSVYDPSLHLARRSLGTLVIASSMQWARKMGYQHYHLGLYLPDHAKMSYKKNYQPAQVLPIGQTDWLPFSQPGQARA